MIREKKLLEVRWWRPKSFFRYSVTRVAHVLDENNNTICHRRFTYNGGKVFYKRPNKVCVECEIKLHFKYEVKI